MKAFTHLITSSIASKGMLKKIVFVTGILFLSSNLFSQVFYSYQSGNWDQVGTWTHDPGGSTHTATGIPADNDTVVILTSRTVTLPADVTNVNLRIIIRNGAFLDMATFRFTNALDYLDGQGTLRLATVNFPVATTNYFVNADRGTTEYYNGSDFTLPATQAVYNNLRINAAGFVATQLSNLTINGNLSIVNGTFRINDNVSPTRLILTINGNVSVSATGSIRVGEGSTNTTTTDPLHWSNNGGTAPYLNYYLKFHTVNVHGNFVNDGNVRFTNLTYPLYNSFPPSASGATSGAASVYFLGASDNNLTCNGITDFYNLIIDKGIDQSFKFTIYSSAYQNFRLFGANNHYFENPGSNPDIRKALWIRTGTLVLDGLTVIPSLAEAGPVPANETSNFVIPSNAALQIDGPNVAVFGSADDYREINAAYGLAAPNNATIGITGGLYSAVSVYGKVIMNDGYFSTKESSGIVVFDFVSGEFELNGGIVDAKQYRASTGATGLASYIQTGGLFVLRGRFQRTPSTYTSVNDLINAPINVNRAENGINPGIAPFNINSADNVFNMSGGEVRIYDVAGGASGEVIRINSSQANYNVTGGMFILIPTTGNILPDAAFHAVTSTAPLGNLIINRASSATEVRLTRALYVYNDLLLNSGVLNANNFDLSIGGNYTINTGTTYTTGTNRTIFMGDGDQLFNVNLAAPLSIHKLRIDKNAEDDVVQMGGTQTTLNVADSLIILEGIFNDGGQTINLAGNVYTTGTHEGTGRLVFNGDGNHALGGADTLLFGNIELTRTTNGTSTVTAGSHVRLIGNLIFSGPATGYKLLNIQRFNLSLAANSTVVGTDANRYVVTNGQAGGGSITKTYSAAFPAFTFPLGVSAYTPASISLTNTPATYGNITVAIGAFEHPAVSTTGQSLTYFWRVKESGFTGLPANSVTHVYNYNEANVMGTEANYIPARYDWTNYTWTSGTAASVDETNNTIGDPWLTNTSNIFGDYTVGDAAFGAVTTYYSRGSGLWSDVNNWSTVGHAGPVAGTIPGVRDAVVIGGNDSIYLANTNPVVANEDPRSCASLQIEVGAALDITYNPASNFGMVISHPNGNGNFRFTCDRGPLAGSTVRTFVFPSGDFSDFNFNLGTTELYTTNPVAGTTFYLPNGVFEYGHLILSPLGGSNIIFGNNDLTIYGNLETRGQNADSWFCPTWVNLTPYPTAPTVPVAKTITILGNMNIKGGGLIWIGNGNLRQDIVVHGDVIVAPWAAISGWTGWGGATNQSLAIGGSLINNTNNAIGGGATQTPARVNFNNGTSIIPVTFFGPNDAFVTNTAGTPGTYFNRVTIDKGNSQVTTLTVNIGGTLTTPADNWLTLKNGMLNYARTGNLNISTVTPLTIPASSSLTINTPSTVYIANGGVNSNDLYLQGNFTLINGTVYVGPAAGTAFNNDIEYSGSGSSELDIWAGNLIVNGQIRRNVSTTTGILNYSQSGGTVTINGNAAVSSRAKLEVLNAGSDFTMSGGTLTIVRGGGGNAYGDLYLRPATSNVTGGEIVFSQGTLSAVQNYLLDADIMLNNITVNATNTQNATVQLLISPLQLNGNLTLSNANSIFDANATYNIDVTLEGNLVNNGTYNARNNLTTFNGGTQTISGTSVTTFYDLTINPSASLSLNNSALVSNDLRIQSGNLFCNTNTLNLSGDLINNSAYLANGTGGVILSGSNQQFISGTGTYGRLELNNGQGARLLNNASMLQDLALTQGIFDANRYIITLSDTSDILGAPFSSTKMITTDGVYSNVGLQKQFAPGATTFTYPIGTEGKYTPAILTITANSNSGYIRVNNINSTHPTSIDPANALNYYWEVTSGGIASFDGNLVFSYLEEDVTGPDEINYVAARLLIPGSSWSESLTVNPAANTATFNYAGVNNVSGEYTAGVSGAFPPNIPEFTTISSGNWTDCSIWTQTGGTPITCPAGGPNGFILTINDTVATSANYNTAYRTIINGRLENTGGFYGHNLGTVSGTGTLYLESALIPAGRYSEFLSCGSNGTLEYGGTGSYTLIADLYDTISGLSFTGTGTRILPDKDLTICNQLVIDGPNLDNSVNNRGLNIMGSMERYNAGTFTAGTGSNATVRFTGYAPQSLGGAWGDFTGANAFNNLEINNGSRLTLNTGAAIEVEGNLLLTDGIIETAATDVLTITNTAVNAVIPDGGSSASYISGPLVKRINQGDQFIFPIGIDNYLGNNLSVRSTQTGTLLWTAEYFRPNPDVSFQPDLTLVNPDEYWTVASTPGSEAVVRISWTPTSGLTPAITTNGPSDMRVAVYDGADWNEIFSISAGTNDNGRVQTFGRHTFATGTDDFTTSCINTTVPLARFAPTGPVCGNAGIPVLFTSSFAINFDYELEYTINGVPQPAVTVSALPYVLPTPVAGTYQLTGFTYNNGGGTGIVSSVTVNVFAEPTPSIAGPDQVLCGANQTTMAANAPAIGTGRWYFVSGTGASLTNPLSNTSTLNGTSSFSYQLQWVITNGTCVSRDTVAISFPRYPDLSTLTSPEICSGTSYNLTNVIIADANNTASTYTYHSASPAIPANQLAGTVVSPMATTNYYILATSPFGCTDELEVQVIVNATPDIDDLADTSGCDSFILPAITGTNLTGNEAYYNATGGLGTQYNAGDVINASDTIYIYDITSTTPACISEEFFALTINLTPQINDLADTSGCESFVLPAITGTNLTGNEGFYILSGGKGTRYNAADVLSASSTIYIYDSTTTAPACISEESFVLTINTTPQVNDLADTSGCESFVLPAITGTNLTGNEGYYTLSGGKGTRYNAADVLSAGGTIYIYDSTTTAPACISEESFVLTINTTPQVNDLADTSGCESFVLPAITGTNLTGNEGYYTLSGGKGTRYNAADVLSASGTIYIYDSTTTAPACISEESFVLTINTTPQVNDLADTSGCENFVLPAITGTNLTGNEGYYTLSGGKGTRYNAADVLSASGTIYIYDSTTTAPACISEESFVLTINTTPQVNDLADTNACDSYTLPAITGLNLTGDEAYYTLSGGNGTRFNPGDVITVATNLYIFDSTATIPSCSSEESFAIGIVISPVVSDIANQTACVQYTLPAITGSSLTGSEAYFTLSGALGTEYNTGDVISATTTLYIYDNNGSCSSEEQFTITIVGSGPVVNDIANQTACVQYTLPAITGSSLTGNEAYFTLSGGLGTQYNAGDVISATTTLYIYDNNGSCSSEEQFTITIVGSGPVVNDIANQTACVQYTLPAITGSSLTGNEAYFTLSGGLGTQYNAGDVISATTTLYIYDNNGSCSSEEQFTITILGSGPVVNDIANQTACVQYTLPAITGSSLTGSEAYFTLSGGLGTQYNAGDVISATTTLYIYDNNGSCSSEEQFTITIVGSGPVVNDIANQTACVQYTLPAITGSSLTGNEAYFTLSGGLGTEYNAGDVISATTTLYIYDNNGSCSSEEQFTITILGSGPVVNDIANQTACVQYTLPAITGSSLTGSEAYFTLSGGLGTSTMPVMSSAPQLRCTFMTTTAAVVRKSSLRSPS
ncbi:MAG: hypothetical protein IPM71_01560 [Bacteroidota bacterium]|nr:MAG: hypothetical protein IPM71_01560 [Bacteroidota bacterium]